MVDPNRKININVHHTSDSDDDDNDLKDEHVEMVKEFEEEFKDRFTERDEKFMEFMKAKSKPPIIVYPYDQFNRSGGPQSWGGGGYRNNHHRGRNNYHYQHRPYNRNFQDNQRRNFNPRYNNSQQRPHDNTSYRPDQKRFRRDE